MEEQLKANEVQEEKSLKRAFFRWMNILITLLLIGIGIFIFVFSQKPSIGTIEKKEGSLLKAEQAQEKEKTYRGENVSFEYPESFRYEAREKGSSIEKGFFLSVGNGGAKSISFSMDPLKSLEDISGRNLREAFSERYKKHSIEIDGIESDVYLNEESGIEWTSFCILDKEVFTISYNTKNTPKTQSEEEWRALISSVRFSKK